MYRLKLVDADVGFNYSNEKVIELESDFGEMSISEVAPNPVRTTSTININLSQTANITIEMYNAEGKIVATLFDGLAPAGTKSIEINAAKFNSGAYTLVLRAGQNTITRKVNIVK